MPGKATGLFRSASPQPLSPRFNSAPVSCWRNFQLQWEEGRAARQPHPRPQSFRVAATCGGFREARGLPRGEGGGNRTRHTHRPEGRQGVSGHMQKSGALLCGSSSRGTWRKTRLHQREALAGQQGSWGPGFRALLLVGKRGLQGGRPTGSGCTDRRHPSTRLPRHPAL